MASDRDVRDKLYGEVLSVDWRGPDAVLEAELALQRLGPEFLLDVAARAILDPASEISPCIRELSVRKPTHLKYYLGGAAPDNSRSYTLWAHDYSQPMPERGPFVEDWHNHRGDFASMHIGGPGEGFVEDRLVAPKDGSNYSGNDFWRPTDDEWENVVTREYQPGDTMAVRGRLDIHRVRQIGAAFTFLIHGPRQRNETQVFRDRQMITYPNMREQDYRAATRLAERVGRPVLSKEAFMRQFWWH